MPTPPEAIAQAEQKAALALSAESFSNLVRVALLKQALGIYTKAKQEIERAGAKQPAWQELLKKSANWERQTRQALRTLQQDKREDIAVQQLLGALQPLAVKARIREAKTPRAKAKLQAQLKVVLGAADGQIAYFKRGLKLLQDHQRQTGADHRSSIALATKRIAALEAAKRQAQAATMRWIQHPELGTVYLGESIDAGERAALLRALNEISRRMKGSPQGRKVLTRVVQLLKKHSSQRPVFLVEHREKWLPGAQGGNTINATGPGIALMSLSERVLTGLPGMDSALIGTLQNELFELAWRQELGEAYATSRKFQALSYAVSRSLTQPPAKDAAKSARNFAKTYQEALTKYTGKGYKSADWSKAQPAVKQTVREMIEFGSGGAYKTFAELERPIPLRVD